MDITGRNIRKRREELGMSMQELADKVGFKSRTSVYRLEHGETDVTISVLRDVANALRTTPETLMSIEEDDFCADPEIQQLAKEIFSSGDKRNLLNASRNSSPEDIKYVTDMLERLSGKR